MKTIESKEDLIKWATEINGGISLQRKCDLQDLYAHSSQQNLDSFFIQANGERKLILCSVNNVMAFDEVERLLSVLANWKVQKQMKLEYVELDRRESALAARERAQQDSRKPIFKKFAILNKTLADYKRFNIELAERVERMRIERNNAILEARQNEVDADKYRTVKELLK